MVGELYVPTSSALVVQCRFCLYRRRLLYPPSSSTTRASHGDHGRPQRNLDVAGPFPPRGLHSVAFCWTSCFGIAPLFLPHQAKSNATRLDLPIACVRLIRRASRQCPAVPRTLPRHWATLSLQLFPTFADPAFPDDDDDDDALAISVDSLPGQTMLPLTDWPKQESTHPIVHSRRDAIPISTCACLLPCSAAKKLRDPRRANHYCPTPRRISLSHHPTPKPPERLINPPKGSPNSLPRTFL